MTTTGIDRRPAARRTRLTPEREQELYTAVVELLREVGYEALTMDRIATATHSGKATLYRQWQSKPQLIATAIRHTRQMDMSGIDTGSLRGDLYELADQVSRVAAKDSDLLAAMAYASRQNEDLAKALREAMAEHKVATFQAVLDRAVARGELPEGSPAAPFLPHLFMGAVFSRPVVEGQDADAAYLRANIDAVILPALLHT